MTRRKFARSFQSEIGREKVLCVPLSGGEAVGRKQIRDFWRESRIIPGRQTLRLAAQTAYPSEQVWERDEAGEETDFLESD